MRGVVEIYQGDLLISREENLIVDSGSEVLADIMTVSPSLANIPTASALLDTSNYTIYAHSTGKDAAAFLTNCHSSSIYNLSAVSAYLTRLTVEAITSGSVVSSYIPQNSLPSYPDPLDRTLETLSDDVYSHLPSSVDAQLIRSFGQNLNVIGLWRVGLSATPMFSSLDISSAALLGCYPEPTGYGFNRIRLVSPSSTLIVQRATYNGNINFYSAMDWRGYVRKREESQNAAAALALSAEPSNVSSLGEVTYRFSLGLDDISLVNLFGGINILGLWCIDINKTLKNGSTPPFIFDSLQPKTEYKLFCKKVFNRNLTYTVDSISGAGLNSHQTITVIWRIYFI